MVAWIPLVVLALVFLLIAVRQIGRFRLQLWQIMLGGAALVLVTGSISPLVALAAINLDVIAFLFCMFLLGYALERSGYLAHMAYHLFKKARSADGLVLILLFGTGMAAALLMNDTIAIIGTPVVLYLARQHRLSPKLMLLALAFAVTIGSVMSPIGNPQNLLIALHGGMHNAFLDFVKGLFIPTIICLLFAFLLLKLFYRDYFDISTLFHIPAAIHDKELAKLCKISLVMLVGLIALKICLALAGIELHILLIAVLAILPLVFSKHRLELVKNVDWRTLVFFAAMFILMQSVWDTGFFQSIIADGNIDVTSVGAILIVSILLSQLISNVPLVALYLPLIAGTSAAAYLALAAGSTIAGNMLILGAASNVIIIQQAEKRGETLTFIEFARVGIPLTVLCGLVYWVFL